MILKIILFHVLYIAWFYVAYKNSYRRYKSNLYKDAKQAGEWRLESPELYEIYPSYKVYSINRA